VAKRAASDKTEGKRRRVFDKAYFERFYGDADTCVTDAEITGRLGAFVCSYLQHLDVDVRQVLDIGCGTGLWRDVVAEYFPAAAYTGVEVSEYLCRTYGWRQGSVVDFRSRGAFDLVICQGVLQYLNESDAREAIINLDRLCKRALFLEVLTREDWNEVCDQSVTDNQCYLRDAPWYRTRLAKHFTNCGGGIYLSKRFEHYVYALDRLE